MIYILKASLLNKSLLKFSVLNHSNNSIHCDGFGIPNKHRRLTGVR